MDPHPNESGLKNAHLTVVCSCERVNKKREQIKSMQRWNDLSENWFIALMKVQCQQLTGKATLTKRGYKTFSFPNAVC